MLFENRRKSEVLAGARFITKVRGCINRLGCKKCNGIEIVSANGCVETKRLIYQHVSHCHASRCLGTKIRMNAIRVVELCECAAALHQSVGCIVGLQVKIFSNFRIGKAS